MSGEPNEDKSPQELRQGKVPAKAEPAAPSKGPVKSDSPVSSASDPDASTPLTPEQQMALYEEKLKEDDWGHQPC